jgi:hypothetical protein
MSIRLTFTSNELSLTPLILIRSTQKHTADKMQSEYTTEIEARSHGKMIISIIFIKL